MIKALVSPQSLSALIKRLSVRAQAQGQQRGAQQLKALRDNPHRWRSAATLWPGFGRDHR